MKNKIIAIVIIILVILGLTYLFSLKQVAAPSPEPVVQNQEPVVKNAEPVNVPEGWKTYQNSEWGIKFAYPKDWKFEESLYPNSSVLYGLKLTGDNYDLFIHKAGTGLPERDWTHPPYTIGGRTTKTWQSEMNGGYEQVMVVGDIQFWIQTPNKEKEISDQILSTVIFTK